MPNAMPLQPQDIQHLCEELMIHQIYVLASLESFLAFLACTLPALENYARIFTESLTLVSSCSALQRAVNDLFFIQN